MVEIRKLAAIMAIDVVGYARLMSEDEAGTARAVRDHRNAARPLVAARGGRIVKTMGDGLLLEFPSVVDAAECAIAIQRLMIERNAEALEGRKVVYRVGVHLGDVLVEGDDILGESVNIAARLEGLCEPGGILISGAAHEHVRGRIEAQFADHGEKQLKNISRPVQVFALKTSAAPAECLAPAKADTSPARRSLLVLPFLNIGGGPEQDYFVDGVTESLTTDLSRIRGSTVIGRNTAFAYKGKGADPRRLGRDLDVRYILQGSVQRSGLRMRVNVELIDAESGSQLWAERFDKPVGDLFDMQDEIVSRLANSLEAQLVKAEARRSERSKNPDAVDLFFQGLARANKGYTPANLKQARDLYDRALGIDPDHTGALVGRAWVDAIAATNFSLPDARERLIAAESALTKALSLAPGNAGAHLIMGIVHIYTNRQLSGIAQCERALALNPNLAGAHGNIAVAKIYLGRAEEAETHIRETLRLSPEDTFKYLWLMVLGTANFLLGNDDDAISWLKRSIEVNRNYPLSHFVLAAALAHRGQCLEAHSAVESGLALQPDFTIEQARSLRASLNPTYLNQCERYYEGLRMAGAPER
jgi:TolB-like protein/class 3 adenylate cyclase